MAHSKPWISALALCLLFSTGQGFATVLTISIEPKSAVKGETNAADAHPTARLIVSPAGEAGMVASQTRPSDAFEMAVPGTLETDLPPGTWSIAFEADDLWAQTRQLELGEDSKSLDIAAWPAGRLAGQVVVPERAAIPTHLTFRVESRSEKDTWQFEMDCPIAGEKETAELTAEFDCQVPAGVVDLRIATGEAIPHYFWDFEIPWRETRGLGRLSLRPGTSVAGWVDFFQLPEGPPEASLAETRVSLVPTLGGFADRDEMRRVESVSPRASANTRGFFQLRGVPPGHYEVVARHPRTAAAHLSSLVVTAGEETLLGTLELWPPVRLEVRVDTPTDPYHKPWTVRLARPTASLTYWATHREEDVGPEGVVVFEGLDRGEVDVALLDSWGSSWSRTKLVLERESTSHTIETRRTRLEVALRIGDEPVPAAWVVMRDAEHHAQITKKSDEGGSAYFFLPVGRTWKAEIQQPEMGTSGVFDDLEVPETEPGERWPKIVLSFPDTTLEGQVVEPDGSALVRPADLQAGGGETTSQGRTRSDGHFVLRGLPAGVVVVSASLKQAHGRERRSDTQRLTLCEGEPAGPLTLTLAEGGHLEGVVLSPAGHGVAGAFVLTRPAAGAGIPFPTLPPQAHTDVDGLFALDLPAGIDRVLLQVFPPGFVPILAEVDRDQEGPVILQTEGEAGDLVIHYDRAPESLLRSDPPGALGRATTVFREGLPLGSGIFLASIWNPLNGIANPHPDLLRIGRLAPGVYTVCWGGGADPLGSGICFEGFLPALGTLDVVIPRQVIMAEIAAATP